MMQNPKNELNVAGMVFYDDDLNVSVQKRDESTRKWDGEEYAFWGGRIENGETPDEAIRRELKEEINYVPKNLEYFGKFEYISNQPGRYSGMRINQYVYIAKITKELLKCHVYEGHSMVIMNIDEVTDQNGFVEKSVDFLIEVKKGLLSRINNS